MNRRTRLLIALAAALLGVAIGYLLQLVIFERRSLPQLTSVQVGGPFTLTAHDGRRLASTELRGKALIVSFGFTFCPDICPLGLARINELLDALGPDAAKVNTVFITVDPARDTPAILKDYVLHFSDRIIGLTGSEAEIAQVARAYRVYYKISGDPATNRNYLVDHSAYIYVMDRDGAFVGTFTHETSIENAAKLVRKAL
jgi:protein SCO1/2